MLSLHSGDYQAKITTAGAIPTSLRYQDRPLIAEWETAPAPLTAQCLLLPWPNRTADGIYAHHGVCHKLTITEKDRNNAIHGLLGYSEWIPQSHSDTSASLIFTDEPKEGWPWWMTYEITWTLDATTGLSATLKVSNQSAEDTAPIGFGWHPYLIAQGAELDDCALRIPEACSYLPLDPERCLPMGPEVPIDDLCTVATKHGQDMRGKLFDHCIHLGAEECYAELLDQRPETRGRGVALWGETPLDWLQVYTADPSWGEPFPGWGRALAVEPMSCPPNALRSGTDLMSLAPSESVEYKFGIRAVTPNLG